MKRQMHTDPVDLSAYHDTGCPDGLIPSCLDCPLPECRYLMPPGKARSLLVAFQVRALRRDGLTQPAVAATLGVSRRTVARMERLRIG